MKHLLLIILVVALQAMTGITADAQETMNRAVTQASWMYAPNAAEYIVMEQEIWKPVHAQRIRDGEIAGWYLYQAVSPDAPQGHNFMTVETYPDWSNVEGAYADIGKLIEEVHGVNAWEWAGPRTNESRKMIQSSWWRQSASIQSEGFSFDKVNYVVIDWMDVHAGHWGDYVAMERDVYMPVHQKRVDAGNILSWALYTNMNYSEAPGSLNAVTTATYADFESLWNRYPENAWEEAHPGVDASEMNKKMLGHRLMTGSTIYRLVDKVEASN